MFQQDYILREIQALTRFLAKAVFQTELESDPLLDESGIVTGEKFFAHTLFALVARGQLNEAENLLFEEIEKHPQQEYLKLAIRFYSRLNAMDDKTLREYNFTREEIIEGLAAIKKIYGEEAAT